WWASKTRPTYGLGLPSPRGFLCGRMEGNYHTGDEDMVACRIGVVALLLLAGPAAPSAEPQRPPGDREPVLQLEAGGPTAAVTALAFSPDGTTLFVAGYDKVVRTWTRGPGGDFVAGAEYRVPIGPGMDGVINALALSSDGRWLAVAGSGVVREAAGFREPGI